MAAKERQAEIDDRRQKSYWEYYNRIIHQHEREIAAQREYRNGLYRQSRETRPKDQTDEEWVANMPKHFLNG